MVELKDGAVVLFNKAFVHVNGKIPALDNLIFQNTPAEFFKQLNLYGPEYEKKGNKKGKHYRSLQNWRKNWKGPGVLEAKVLQYVPQDVRSKYEEPAPLLPASTGTAASPNDALAPAPAGVPVTPANRSSTVDVQQILAQIASQQLASQQHNDRERAEDRELTRQTIAGLSSQIGTLAVNTEQRFNLHEDRFNKQDDKISRHDEEIVDLRGAVKVLWEQYEEEKEKQVTFTTHNEYFTIPARASAKKRKPALSKKDDQSTPTQPVARSTRSRSVQGSTPKRTTRSSSRRDGK